MANLKTSLELDIKPFIDAINRAANSLKRIDDINVKFNRSEFAKLEAALKRIPTVKNITTNVLGEAEAIRDLNQVEKNVKQIPNSKNINVNVDKNSSNRISQQLGGLTNQTSKLGTGLTGAFGGAAVGAAVAAFAYKAGRALLDAGKTADNLADQLDTAFSQAGFTGNELEQQVANAQKFSSKLADDFGIAEAETTKILARVTTLTGLVGEPAQEITKAVLGIEKASDGAITAQKAIQFFTKSLGGDPEAEAALDTLTAKFPALAAVINSTATASEKAVQINEELIGTFDALARDAQSGFKLFDRIGERLTLAIGKGVNDSLDVFAPLLQRLLTGVGDLEGPLASAFESLNVSFLEPLVKIIEDFIERFQALNTEGSATRIFFTSLEQGGNALLFVFEALSEITLGVADILKLFAPEIEFLVKLLVDGSKTLFAVTILQIKTAFVLLSAVLTPVRFILDKIYEGFGILADIISIFDPELVGLIKNFDFFKYYVDQAKNSLETFTTIWNVFVAVLTGGFTISIQFVIEKFKELKNMISGLAKTFDILTPIAQKSGIDFQKIGNAALLAIPGLNTLVASLGFVTKAYDNFKGVLRANVPNFKEGPAIDDLGSALRDRRGSTKIPDSSEKTRQLEAEAAERLRLANLKKTGGGGGKTPTESAVEKDLKAFKEYTDFINTKATTALKLNNLQQEVANYNRLIGASALDKLNEKQKEVNAGIKTQEEILAKFTTTLGLNSDKQEEGLKKIIDLYKDISKTSLIPGAVSGGNEELIQLSLQILPPKTTKEDAKKFLDELLKQIDAGIDSQIAKKALQVEFKDLEFKLNKELIANNLDDIQADINFELANIAIGIPATVGQDVFKELLNSLIKQNKAFTNAYDKEIYLTQKKIDEARFEFFALTTQVEKDTAPGDVPLPDSVQRERLDNLRKSIKTYTAQLSELKSANRDAENTTNKAREALNKLPEGYANAGLASEEYKYRTIDTFKKLEALRLDKDLFNLELKLNTEGVSQDLIAVEKDVLTATRNLEIQSKAFLDRLAIDALADFSPLGTVTSAFAITAATVGVNKALEKQKGELRVAKNEAVNEVKKANDVLFALQGALANNLANVISPDTTGAKSVLDKKKQDINSEVELLKAKLEIENQLNADNLEGRSLSYQEYTEKILDLEKEKNDAIKVYDDEVNAKRLESLQKIASETLPAINEAVLLSQNTLSDSLKQGTDSFTEQANKALEVIGVVAVQSLALAIQQSKTMEEIQKQFLKNVVAGLLKVLQAELIAAALQGLFEDVKKAGTLGLISGAILTATLGTLFAIAQAKINTLIDGFSEGGYTGNGNRNAVAGIVHGQEYVINAESTKRNRAALEYANNGGNLKDFFKSSGPEINTFVDTKNMSNSINGLANAMDSRLSSLETTVDRAIRQSSTTMRSQNSVDVSVYSDPGTTIKYMKKMGKIKGLS